MKSKKTIINGITFEDLDGFTLMAEDLSITVMCVNENEQAFSFINTRLEGFSDFFDKYNCVSILFEATETPALMNLDAIRHRERITKLALLIGVPTDVTYSGQDNPFENLSDLTFSGYMPNRFPDLHRIQSLRTLTIDYDKNAVDQWIDLQQIDDLHIIDYREKDLTPLQHLSSVKRLKLSVGNLKSLAGIERMPKLETLFISNAKKLVDVAPLLNSPSLKNVMFENYKKIEDWGFLATKKDLRCICLDRVESTDFIKTLPDLQFFYCRKARDRNSKSILFSTKLHQETMTREGIQVSYIVAGDVFYQPLELLKSS
jgi:hypothetical protein